MRRNLRAGQRRLGCHAVAPSTLSWFAEGSCAWLWLSFMVLVSAVACVDAHAAPDELKGDFRHVLKSMRTVVVSCHVEDPEAWAVKSDELARHVEAVVRGGGLEVLASDWWHITHSWQPAELVLILVPPVGCSDGVQSCSLGCQQMRLEVWDSVKLQGGERARAMTWRRSVWLTANSARSAEEVATSAVQLATAFVEQWATARADSRSE